MDIKVIGTEISKKDCFAIAEKIRDKFYKPRSTYKTTIFLCGADINDKTKTRHKIREAFSELHYSIYYDLLFPEDLFDEFLYSSQGKDLQSLENLLADSIDVILIIPESPGSYAELGAFANDEYLRKKMVCIVDEKYKRDKSFINQGPVKLIKLVGNHGVVYIDPHNLAKGINKVHRAIREVKKANEAIPRANKNISLLQLDNFLLPVIYLLEPISFQTIVSCIEFATADEMRSPHIATTIIGIMMKKKFIELTSSGSYKLTKFGKENYWGFNRISSRIKIQDRTVALDELRLEILNLQLRNRKLRI